MRKVIPILTIINSFALGAFLLYHFFAENKVAYVDSSRLINNYKGMTEARTAYQQKAQVWKANVDTLIHEVQLQIQKYEKESAKMTSRERELSKQLIQTKQQQAIDYQKATNEKATQEESQMTESVVDEINKQIKEYGEHNQYKIILVATDYGNIAYAEEGMDITEKVLEVLNKKYTGK